MSLFRINDNIYIDLDKVSYVARGGRGTQSTVIVIVDGVQKAFNDLNETTAEELHASIIDNINEKNITIE